MALALLAGLACLAIGVRPAPAAHTKAETAADSSDQDAPPKPDESHPKHDNAKPGEAEAKPGEAEAKPGEAEAKPGEARHGDSHAKPAEEQDLSTPKGALKAYNADLPAGGMKAAESAYFCSNDEQRRAAHAMAEVDMATARLESAAREKFGAGAVDPVLHAARNATLADLDAARVSVEGDRATVDWQNHRPSVPMVRVDGKWRVSTADVLREVGPDFNADEFVRVCTELAHQLDDTTQEAVRGDYANVNLLARAVSQRMFRVLGEDEADAQ